MGIRRKNHSDKFKARVALEAAKELKTTAELWREFSIHPNQILKWKQFLLESAHELFVRGKVPEEQSREELVSKLRWTLSTGQFLGSTSDLGQRQRRMF
jgi:putative transposase